MKNIFFTIVFAALLLAGTALADEWPVCIDMQAPSAPGNPAVTGNLHLSWAISTDTPACSGIGHYKIYVAGVLKGTTAIPSYSSAALPDGTYTISVSAVDRAGNEGPNATTQVTFPLSSPPVNPPAGGSGGSGGGGSGGTTVVASTNTCNVSYDFSLGQTTFNAAQGDLVTVPATINMKNDCGSPRDVQLDLQSPWFNFTRIEKLVSNGTKATTLSLFVSKDAVPGDYSGKVVSNVISKSFTISVVGTQKTEIIPPRASQAQGLSITGFFAGIGTDPAPTAIVVVVIIVILALIVYAIMRMRKRKGKKK
jgi:hypothetical protein